MRIGSYWNAVTNLEIWMTSSPALSESPCFCFQVRWEEAESPKKNQNAAIKKVYGRLWSFVKPDLNGEPLFSAETPVKINIPCLHSTFNFSGCSKCSVGLFSVPQRSFPLKCQQKLISRSVFDIGLYSRLRPCTRISVISVQMEASFRTSRLIFSSFVRRASGDGDWGIWFTRHSSSVDDTPGNSISICSISMMVKLSTPRYFSCEPASYIAEFS